MRKIDKPPKVLRYSKPVRMAIFVLLYILIWYLIDIFK